jgi:rod shape-determining protein MreD
MLKKIIFFIFLFYILILLQTSFLIPFSIAGIIPNLVLVAVILVNLFNRTSEISGLIVALIGGLYLDIFSISFFGFFGFYTLISLIISLFLKFILKNYVKIPSLEKF